MWSLKTTRLFVVVRLRHNVNDRSRLRIFRICQLFIWRENILICADHLFAQKTARSSQILIDDRGNCREIFMGYVRIVLRDFDDLVSDEVIEVP